MHSGELPRSGRDRASTSARVQQLRDEAENDTGRLMQEMYETGKLAHLYGKPLNLENDPSWLVNRVLKEQGFSHPLIELRRDLDAPRNAADAVLARLRRHRKWLTGPDSRPTPYQIHGFNEALRNGEHEYREKLASLNAAIRDYNLTVPDAIQVRPVLLDAAMARMRNELQPLEFVTSPVPHRTRFSFRLPWRRNRAV